MRGEPASRADSGKASLWICRDVSVFVERVSAPREGFRLWEERLRMVTDRPPVLVASMAWESDNEATCINVGLTRGNR
jgi:hypothetical protein